MPEPRPPQWPTLILPLLLVVAGIALALWFGASQQRLAGRIAGLERELAEQRAEIGRLSEALQARPAANPAPPVEEAPAREANEPEVLAMVLDSLGHRDVTRQRALVSYLERLPDPQVRRRLLVLLRDEASDPLAAKRAGALLGRPIEVVEPTAGQPARLPFGLVAEGQPEGWDYDVFVCRSTLERADANLPSEIDRLLASLRSADPRHGRIRLSPLEPAVRQNHAALATAGLFLLADQGRGDEARQAVLLTRRLAFDGFDFATRRAAAEPSPWYIALFYCPQ